MGLTLDEEKELIRLDTDNQLSDEYLDKYRHDSGSLAFRKKMYRAGRSMAVPANTTKAQWVEINRAVEYGKNRGVKVTETQMK
ncbi:hypothetical protein SLY17_000605 [Cronobacter dublinensis]|nr:hypothetical protein [Cronobacter dublinensis]